MIDMDRFEDQIYLLNKGVRSCFSDILCGDKKHIEESVKFMREVAHKNGYKIIFNILPNALEDFEVKEGKKCYEYYVCKYDHQIKVINRMNNIKDKFMIEFIKGNLLGYSPDNMEKYLMKVK